MKKIKYLSQTKIINIYKHIAGSTVLRNSLNLIIGTGIASALGFIFWIIIARSYDAEAVGVATLMLTVSGVVAILSLVGLDVVYVRFLARFRNRSELISAGFILTGLISIIFSIVCCIFAGKVSQQLGVLGDNTTYTIVFVVLTLLTTWNLLINSIFVAIRKTIITLFIILLTNSIKLVLPILAFTYTPLSILIILGFVQSISVLLGILLLIKKCDFKPTLRFPAKYIFYKFRYSSGAYFSNVINLLPDLVLPLIVASQLGLDEAAYFYISFTIANLLYTIAFSTSQVSLAESAHDEKNYILQARHSLKIIFSLMLPAVVILILFAPYILGIFGTNYSDGATSLLRIFALSGLVVMPYSVLSYIFKHTQNMKALVILMTSNAIAIIGLSMIWVNIYGLTGVGFAWLVGTSIAVIFGIISLRLVKNKPAIIKSTLG